MKKRRGEVKFTMKENPFRRKYNEWTVNHIVITTQKIDLGLEQIMKIIYKNGPKDVGGGSDLT